MAGKSLAQTHHDSPHAVGQRWQLLSTPGWATLLSDRVPISRPRRALWAARSAMEHVPMMACQAWHQAKASSHSIMRHSMAMGHVCITNQTVWWIMVNQRESKGMVNDTQQSAGQHLGMSPKSWPQHLNKLLDVDPQPQWSIMIWNHHDLAWSSEMIMQPQS